MSYYDLRNGDIVEYKFRMRPIKVMSADQTIKIIIVDDSKTIDQHLDVIYERFHINRYRSEYSLILMNECEQQVNSHSLQRSNKNAYSYINMNSNDWVDYSKTLRDLGFTGDNKQLFVLKRKYFLFDDQIDTRDEIELKLLYAQIKHDIINGTLEVSINDAINFAAIQTQIELV